MSLVLGVMRLKFAALAAMILTVPVLFAGEKSDGKAAAELHSMQETVNPGQAFWVAFRLKPDSGWHTYWTNPGQGGMPTSVSWKLPKGWEASPLAFPVPHRIQSMGMTSLGFEEETFMFSKISVPEDAVVGPVQLAGTLSWLTCDEANCIPGTVELLLPLEVTKNTPKSSGDAAILAEKLASMPKNVAWLAKVAELGDKLVVTISGPEMSDLSESDLLFAVEDISGNGKPKWQQVGNDWVATVEKSEYFKKVPSGAAIVLFDGKLDVPVIVTGG